MRVKFATLIAATGMVLGGMALPAQAATGTATAQLVVNVNTVVTVTFDDHAWGAGIYNFGQTNPGSVVDAVGALTYVVATNNPTGFSLDITNGSGTPAWYSWSQDGFSTTSQLTGSPPSIIGWRSEATNGSGSFSYSDDVRLTLPSNAPGGVRTTNVDYVATTL
jgi:hypothetical protein